MPAAWGSPAGTARPCWRKTATTRSKVTPRVVPVSGTAFLSVRKADQPAVAELAGDLMEQGYKLVATRGTANVIKAAGIDCQVVNKVTEGRPHIVDMIKNGHIDLIVNTTEGKQAIADSYAIRTSGQTWDAQVPRPFRYW